MTFEELDKILETAYAPFMLSLSDCTDNELTVRISPACIGEPSEDTELVGRDEPNPVLRELLNKSRPLLPDEKRVYEITFDNYIIYQIGNESYCSGNPNDKYSGGFLRVYERSALLEHIGDLSDAQVLNDGAYYPGKWTHYEIVTQNHIIDIISVDGPVVNISPPT